MKLKTLAASAALLVATATSGYAATFDIFGSWSDSNFGDVTFDFTVEGDFSQSIPNVRNALTVNDFTSSAGTVNPLPTLSAFVSYNVVNDTLFIESSAQFVDGLDFSISFDDFTSLPSGQAFDSLDLFITTFDPFTAPSVATAATATAVLRPEPAVPAVPLPAGGLLLLTGLGGIAALKRRKKHIA